MSTTIDYRALLVRYMAMVLEAEGVNFIDHGDEFELTEDEKAVLRSIADEASALLHEDDEPVDIGPKFTVWLRGEQVKDVLSFVQYDDGNGKSIAVERYARDCAGNLINAGGIVLTETIVDDFEIRRE